MAPRLPFDPRAVLMYHGYRFLTKNFSQYIITGEGKIVAGRSSDIAETEGVKLAGGEGVKIRMLAAIAGEHYNIQRNGVPPMRNREEFDRLIMEHGQEPAPGLHLVVSLAADDSELMNTLGMITSPIYRVFMPGDAQTDVCRP